MSQNCTPQQTTEFLVKSFLLGDMYKPNQGLTLRENCRIHFMIGFDCLIQNYKIYCMHFSQPKIWEIQKRHLALLLFINLLQAVR